MYAYYLCHISTVPECAPFRNTISVFSPSPVRRLPAPISGFLSAKPNSGRRGPVSSMPTVFVTARPFSVRLRIALVAFLCNPRWLYPKPPHECGESCNSLSRSDSSRVWTFYQISLQDFIPYGILDRKKTGKSNF